MITPPAQSIVRYRVPLLLFWAVALLFSIPRASRVHESLQVEGEPILDSESDAAGRLIREAFPEPIAHFFVVTLSAPGPVDSGGPRAVLASLTEAAEAQPYVTRVLSYLNTRDSNLVSADHLTTFFVAVVEVDEHNTATDRVPAFRRAIHNRMARQEDGVAVDRRIPVRDGQLLCREQDRRGKAHVLA